MPATRVQFEPRRGKDARGEDSTRCAGTIRISSNETDLRGRSSPVSARKSSVSRTFTGPLSSHHSQPGPKLECRFGFWRYGQPESLWLLWAAGVPVASLGSRSPRGFSGQRESLWLLWAAGVPVASLASGSPCRSFGRKVTGGMGERYRARGGDARAGWGRGDARSAKAVREVRKR